MHHFYEHWSNSLGHYNVIKYCIYQRSVCLSIVDELVQMVLKHNPIFLNLLGKLKMAIHNLNIYIDERVL